MEEDQAAPAAVPRKKWRPAGVVVVAWAVPKIEMMEAEQARTAQQLWLLQRVCSGEHGNGEKEAGGRIEREGNGNG